MLLGKERKEERKHKCPGFPEFRDLVKFCVQVSRIWKSSFDPPLLKTYRTWNVSTSSKRSEKTLDRRFRANRVATELERAARNGRSRNGDKLAGWKIFEEVGTRGRGHTLAPSAISSGAEGSNETARNFLYYVKSFYEHAPWGRLLSCSDGRVSVTPDSN